MGETSKEIKKLNQLKFDRITFATDYLKQMYEMQNGELKIEDFCSALSKFYDGAFDDGMTYVLDRYIYAMFHDLDEIEKLDKE